MERYDVFISSKSEDYKYAEEIYNFLLDCGIKVFFADKEIKKLGESEYSRAIDKALEISKHMIVFASKKDYINSKWVESEWRSFINEIRSNRKNGNLITILKDLDISDLPVSLKNYQSLTFYNYKESLRDYLDTDSINSHLDYGFKYFLRQLIHSPFKVISIFIISVLFSIAILYLLLSLFVCNESAITAYNLDEETKFNVSKEITIKSLDSDIKYYAGQMDSAYNVAFRASKMLEDFRFAELCENEYGTLEYNEDKSDHMLNVYFDPEDDEINPYLIDYVDNLRLYCKDFYIVDSLYGEINSLKKQQYVYNKTNIPLLQYKIKVLFNDSFKSVLFILSIILVLLTVFFALSFILYKLQTD